jgi:L-asparaginase II
LGVISSWVDPASRRVEPEAQHVVLSEGSLSKGVWCTRSGVVESLHRVHAAVVTDAGKILAQHGNVDWVTVYRSAAKPFQAIPLVDDGVVAEFGLEKPEVALTAASHNGEDIHLEGVARILEKVGQDPESLRLGPFPPLLPEAAEALYRSGAQVTPVHNNCSGQHAAMLGLVQIHGWPMESYLDPDHPLQDRMMEEMVRFTGMDRGKIRTMPDGCGMVAFGVPLRVMARSFATLGTLSGTEAGPAHILDAMATHSYMLGGKNRLCSALPEVTRGRLIGKLGAEGVYCVSVPGEGLGIAVKVEDGGIRAGDSAAVRVLDLFGLLEPEEAEALQGFRRTTIRNTLGEDVGELFANFDLES